MRAWLCLALLAAGCGTSFEDFNRERYEAVCNANDECRRIQGVELQGDCTFPVDDAITNPDCTYNATLASRCLREIANGTCDEANPAVFVVPPVCEEVVTNCQSSFGGGGDDTEVADDTDPDDTDAG